MTLREHYDETLQEIRADILKMGGIAGEMVRLAVEAVLNGDIEISNKVVGMDDEVDALEEETIRRTVLVFAMQAPVAADLRMLVTTVGVIGEIEKVGDDAVKLARRATKLTGHFPGEFRRTLSEVGDLARKTFAASLRLYAEYDEELARAIIEGDEEIDEHYLLARTKLLKLTESNPQDAAHLARTIEAFHALEHVADHAAEIADRMRMVYGRRPSG